MSKLWEIIRSPSAMAVLAIMGVAVAIYQGFIYERRGQISISVDQPSRVFDIHQPIGGLEVSYAGQDLRSTKKTLWIINADVRNVGNAEIRKSDYDDQVPLGLRVSGGQIVDSPTFRTGITYLQQNLKLTPQGQHLLLSPVIFEPDDAVHLSLLVLGSDSAPPAVSPLGKIAGSRAIVLTNSEGRGSATSTWGDVTSAENWWSHPLRFLLYGIGGLLTLIGTAALVAAIGTVVESLMEKRSIAARRSRMDGYGAGEDLAKETRFISNEYVQRGEVALYDIRDVLACLRFRLALANQIGNAVSVEELVVLLRSRYPLPFDGREAYNGLMASKLVSEQDGRPVLSENLTAALNDVFTYLGLDAEKTAPNRVPYSRQIEARKRGSSGHGDIDTSTELTVRSLSG